MPPCDVCGGKAVMNVRTLNGIIPVCRTHRRVGRFVAMLEPWVTRNDPTVERRHYGSRWKKDGGYGY